MKILEKNCKFLFLTLFPQKKIPNFTAEQRFLLGHTATINALALSPNSTVLASSQEGKIAVVKKNLGYFFFLDIHFSKREIESRRSRGKDISLVLNRDASLSLSLSLTHEHRFDCGISLRANA